MYKMAIVPSPSIAPTARVLTRTAGLPALLRAVPAYAVLALAASILFSPNGMRAVDLLRLVASSPATAASLWSGWILLTVPAARALFETSETFFLRSLPVPPWHFWLVHAAHLLALQGPWMLLWLRGEGLVAALAAGVIAGAAAALVVARPRDARDLLAAALLLVAAFASLPAAIRLGLGLAAGALAIPAAWTRAASRGVRRGRSRVGGSAATALLLAHAVILARRDASTLLRGGLAVLIGAVVFAFVVRNNGPDAAGHEATLALFAAALPLAIATGGVAAKTLETERRLEWLLLSTGASARLRALTALAIPTITGALAGLVHGSLGALLVSCDAALGLEITLLSIALGASLGAVAAHGSRRAEQPSGVDGTRVVVTMIVAVAVVLALLGWLGIVAVATIAAAAILFAAAAVRLVTAQDRLRDPSRRAAWGAA
jgi:hypothetical protein